MWGLRANRRPVISVGAFVAADKAPVHQFQVKTGKVAARAGAFDTDARARAAAA